ncbi:MAG: phosphate ABC transporter permease PstA, partial [Cyanobacteria bacterium J06641_5]
VPIGVLAAVYLSEFSPKPVARWIRFATNVLSGVPSIISGVFAFGLIVATTKSFSAVAGGIALAVLMLPIIVRTTDEALQIVPQEVRWASVGLGASKYTTALRVVVPAALPAILTGVTLSVARAAGETAPLIFTALFSFFWPQGLFEPTPSLAVLVYNFAIVPFKAQQELAWAASLILVFIVLLASVLARLAVRGNHR